MFMKRLLFVIGAFSLLSVLSVSAEVSKVQGTVSKLTGSATMIAPGSTTPVELKVGDRIPQGAIITTGMSSTLLLRTFAGTVATASANTTFEVEQLTQTTTAGVVTKETTMIGLKSGNLVSTLDPTKRAVNNYGVRTPKGVAAARGTVFSSEVLSSGLANVNVTDGAVTVVFGGQTYSMVAGTISFNGGTPISMAAAVSDPATAAVVDAMLAAAVEAVSQVVEQGSDLPADSSTSVLAAVTQVAVTASVAQEAAAANNPAIPAPAQSAEQITARVVAAVTTSTSSTSASSAAVSAAVGAVTQAAATGAVSGTAQAAATQASAAVLASGGTAAQAQAAAATAAANSTASSQTRVALVTAAANATVQTAAASNPTIAASASAIAAAVTRASTTAANNASTTATQAANSTTNPTQAATPRAPTATAVPTTPAVDPGQTITVSPSA